MLTDVLARRRRRTARSLSQSEIELYRDLARTSGGQTIEVTKSDLSLATTVIEDSTATAVVRHWVRSDWRMYECCAWTVHTVLILPHRFLSHSRLCSSLFQVTVFQAALNPGRPEKFTFIVDASLSNMIIYITGVSSLTFTLTSSTGSDMF